MSILDPVLISLAIINFYLLGSSRMRAVIYAAGIQGVILGLLPAVIVHNPGLQVVAASLLATGIKGCVFPLLLFRAMREVGIRREIQPSVSYVSTLLLGALGAAAAIRFGRTLPLVDHYAHSLLVPIALSTVWTGFLLLITRTKAITQVVGYLVLENGVFLFGITLVHALPFVIELGILLDLFVGVFIMGIIINHIQRTFSSLDTSRMNILRD